MSTASKLWHYLNGYVIISMEGFNLERVLNRASRLGLWGVRRRSYTRLTACASLGAYKELAAMDGVRLTLLARRGVPVWFLPLKGRPAFFVGALLFLALVIGSGLLVWDVKVVGAQTLDPAAVAMELEEMGIRRWAFIPELPLEQAQAALMKDTRVGWASVRVDGVEVTVEIVETQPQVIPAPGDVVARFDGVVRRMTVINGTAKVAEGDKVVAGQVLISGTVPRAAGFELVPAEGRIEGSVFSAASETMPRTYSESQRTGAVHCQSWLQLFGWRVDVAQEPAPFAEYAVESRSMQLAGERMFLPFYYNSDYYYEIKTTTKAYPEQQLREMLRTAALEKARAGLPQDAAITGQEVVFEAGETGLKATALVEAGLDIGQSKPYETGEVSD